VRPVSSSFLGAVHKVQKDPRVVQALSMILKRLEKITPIINNLPSVEID